MTFAQLLEGLLWPERFPPGHPRHDEDHVFWSGDPGPDDVFEWDAEVIEWVALAVSLERKCESNTGVEA